jgi:hypothetical protein
MIAYRLFGDGHTLSFRYASQSHLLQMTDSWGLHRIAHYSSQCVVYLPDTISSSVQNGICVVPLNGQRPELAAILPWATTADAYTPLRDGTVESTPNGGSCRTSADLAAWCDEGTDALTRHHVVTNGHLARTWSRTRRTGDPSARPADAHSRTFFPGGAG